MAKRISTDAKIVLSNAGYVVEYVYGRLGNVVGLEVWKKPFEYVCQVPVEGACVDNDIIENLIEEIRK